MGQRKRGWSAQSLDTDSERIPVSSKDLRNERWNNRSVPGRKWRQQYDWAVGVAGWGQGSASDWQFGAFKLGGSAYTYEAIKREWTNRWPIGAPDYVKFPIAELGETTSNVVPYPGYSKVWLDPVPGRGQGQYMVNMNVLYGGSRGSLNPAYPHIDEFKVPSEAPFLSEGYGVGTTGVNSLY